VQELRTGATVAPPPLLKGYLRLGAKICGAPAWDPDFNTADFLTLLRISEIGDRYARHFMAD
jgi:putative hemolysin